MYLAYVEQDSQYLARTNLNKYQALKQRVLSRVKSKACTRMIVQSQVVLLPFDRSTGQAADNQILHRVEEDHNRYSPHERTC